MSAGSTVDTDVFLDVHGDQIKAAFDAIDARIAGIQKHIETIASRAAAAGNAFGGGLQDSLGKFNKISGQLDAFQRNVTKNNPELKKQEEITRAYAQREKDQTTASNARMRQEAQMWAAQDTQRLKSAESVEQRKSALGQQRWERERAAELQTERERARLSQQNRLKFAKDQAQQQVTDVRGIRELEAQRVASAQRLAQARSMRGQFGVEEDRQLANVIALEKQRIGLIDQRVKAEQKAMLPPTTDGAINGRLNVRSARIDERDVAAALGLGAAKARQADIEARIVANIERARILTGAEKVDAERALKVDEARLGVINQRIRLLQQEHDRQLKLAQTPPTAPGGTKPPAGGGGLFGATGIGGIFARTAAYGGAAAAIYGTISAIKDGITYSIQFDDAMARLSAISGSTGTQMVELAGTIAEVGKQSRFSTLDLVEAATVLAQAGFTQGEIAESLKSISQLATASGVTIAEATDVVTSAIGSFQLQASETSHINDVLASALNRTKLNIQQVALGIQYAGATAHEQNISFEELTATMAVMANAGIRSGSTIGTGLRQFLVDLQNPTKKLSDEMKKLGISMQDIDVAHLGLPEVLNRLAAAGFDSAAAYGALEKRAAAAYIVLRGNRQAIQEQIIAQNQIGQSAEAAAKGQDTLASEWQRFKNVLNDTVHNGIEPAENALKSYLKTLNDYNSDPNVQRLLKGDDVVTLPGVGTQVSESLSRYLALKKDVADAELVHAAAIEETTTALNKATDEVSKQKTAIGSLDDSIARVYIRGKELSSNQLALQAEVATLTSRFQGLASYLDGTALSYNNLTAALHAYRLEQLRAMGTALQSQAVNARAQGSEYIGQANSITQAGLSDGSFARLPKNVQGLYRQAIANPGNDIVRRQLFDASAKLPAELKHFVDEFNISLDKGVNAMRISNQARSALDVVGHLESPHGQQLQQMVSSLPGKSDGQIKSAIADLQKMLPGKSSSVRQALASLIEQAQGFLGSGNGPQAPESKKKGNDKALHAQERRDRTLTSLSLKADAAELANAIKAVTRTSGSTSVGPNGDISVSKDRTLTAAQLQKNLTRVNGALDAWIKDRTDQVQHQIRDQKMSPTEAKEMLDDLQREIDAKREEVGREVGEQIAKALDVMVKAVTDVADRAEEMADHQQHLADSRVTALGRANLQGKVPDFVQATYERAAARAKDDRDRSQVSIQEAELAGLRKARDQAASVVDAAGGAGVLGNDDPVIQKLKDLNDQITILDHSTSELKASFGGEGLIPQSFNAQMQMAIENYREVNHLTASWSEMIGMNLTDALGTAQGALSQFLTDATSGTMTVQQAWKNMVMSLIKYLQQLLIKMIAVKLMQMALNIFAPGSSGLGASVNPIVNGIDPLAPRLYGGQIKAMTGRYITAGVPSRDSVNARIAKGEYVVRKSAVDSVGVDFMNRLNERGSMALRAMSPKIMMPPPAMQNMSVYIVPKDELPQMGPNDVLAVISNDIVKGGQTKQLIKHVSQGG